MYLLLLVVISAYSFVLSLLSISLTGFFDMLVILSAILLPIKSPVASSVFCVALLEAVFIAPVADFLAVSIVFFFYLTFYLCF